MYHSPETISWHQMRFFLDGPNIPDLLLERRDQGRVVFLCGAGVSFNAGMPTFVDLTKHVVDFFDPPPHSQLATAFRSWNEKDFDGPRTPLDQIFHLLYHEYGREDVGNLVTERLQIGEPGNVGAREHKLIARISSDRDGSPQIVTTNFDRLFEQVGDVDVRRVYEPPAFPDIDLGVPISGITYLHGRLQDVDVKHHPYVLSSADLGRAYLSEGWATKFIRSLLHSYTVVLIGYQAEDPPVRYLLQGLNHDGMSDRSKLYSFDKGLVEDIEVKWRDRGVTVIPYRDHPDLWQSLEAWAQRADDPRAWRSTVVGMASKGPRQLEAHERGQVAHVVRTTPGARLFANANPNPKAEWLCVFDAYCRAAEKSSGYGADAEVFDPLEAYGLDDDPPRPSASERPNYLIHDHLLGWRRGDTSPSTSHGLGGRPVSGFDEISTRLWYLSHWIAKNLDCPVTAWWAARQNGLHPQLTSAIQHQLRQNAHLSQKARRTWQLILEFQSEQRHFTWDNGWFDLKDQIDKEGWSCSVVRSFESTTSPMLSRNLPLGIGASKPPFKGWDETDLEELARWEIKYPDRHGEDASPPDDVLEQIFRIVESHVHRAKGLLSDIETTYFTTPTCYPDREIEGQDRDQSGDALVCWILGLFVRMLEQNPTVLRAHAINWPTEDRFYFRKLKLFAMNHSVLFEADEAAKFVLGLSQECFWDANVVRELLFLICDRWEEFSASRRTALVNRLLDGPERKKHWSDENYPQKRDECAALYTKWLIQKGLSLCDDQTVRLNEMVSALPEWNESWAANIVTEHTGSIGCIGADEAPDALIGLSVDEVVERAEADLQRDFNSFTEKRPFTGLVKVNPRKALASLSFTTRNGRYPLELWEALIRNWPDDTNPRLNRVFLSRLRKLPEEQIRNLRYAIGEWIKQKFVFAFGFDEGLAWETFDALTHGLVSDGGSGAASSLIETRVGGEVVQNSRRTFGHAMNGPVGGAIEGLLGALIALELPRAHGIPAEFKARIEYLLDTPGEGADHVVAMLTHEIGWLHYLDSDWVMHRIVPLFSFDHPSAEPAWNGYLSAAKFPPHDIGLRLKPMFLKIFPTIYSWSWDRDLAKIAAQMVVELGVFRKDEPDCLDKRETRHCIREMSDKNRKDAVFRLGQIGRRERGNWKKHVVPFINDVWPRERVFRTSSLVSSWINLLDDTGEDFPDVLIAARRFLVPVQSGRIWLDRFSRRVGDEEQITAAHPGAVLEVLDAVVPDSPEHAPRELDQILNIIAERLPSLTSDRRFRRLIDLVEMR